MEYDAFVSYSHAADGRLAPALQSGLSRLARPVFARRALRVFRDETGLTTSPHLWDSIEEALLSSEWFVLLASPESAASVWVDREVAAWVEARSVDRILIVVTDGDLVFDPAGRVDVDRTNCLVLALARSSTVGPDRAALARRLFVGDSFGGDLRAVDVLRADEEIGSTFRTPTLPVLVLGSNGLVELDLLGGPAFRAFGDLAPVSEFWPYFVVERVLADGRLLARSGSESRMVLDLSPTTNGGVSREGPRIVGNVAEPASGVVRRTVVCRPARP